MTRARSPLASLLALALITTGLACASAPKEQPESRSAGEGAEPTAADGSVLMEAAVADAGLDPARVDSLGAWVGANVEGDRYRVPVEPDDLSYGSPEARVTFVVFSDYQCPYCQRLHDGLLTLVETYPTDVRVVFKHMPLSMHNRAEPAARALIAAQAQGAGLAMHEALFANQSGLDDAGLQRMAKAAGIHDPRRFQADLDQGLGDAQIARDTALAKQLGVTSTPTYFINGTPGRGAKTFEQLRELYIAELDVVDRIVAAGAARSEVYASIMAAASPTREAPARPASKPRPGKPDPSKRYAVPVDGRPSLGPDDARVTIIEFADYECPYCRKVQLTVDDVRQRYGKDVRVVLRQNPLPMHKNAEDAALAALAAERQGQFWAMTNLLFEAAEQRNLGDYDALAQQLGLDLKRFRKDMRDPKLAKQIDEDQEIARRFGSMGTPAFFVNGRPLSGAQPIEAFVALVDEELAEAKKFAKANKGVSGTKLYATMAKGWETEVTAPPIAEHSRKQIAVADLPGTGNTKNPTIEIVGCIDFDCPYCSRGAELMDQVLTTKPYAGKVAYHFAHFPLPMHKTAEAAHRAAIAAGEQGQFWAMHDLLFEDRTKRSEADLIALAKQLGLDTKKFLADLNSAATGDKITADKAMCSGLGVSGTPTFFVNGRTMRGAVPFDMAKQVLDEELAGGFEAKP